MAIRIRIEVEAERDGIQVRWGEDHVTSAHVETRRRLLRQLTRSFLILLGLAGVAWGVTNFSAFWRQAAIEQIASEILDQETFKPKALDPFIPILAEIEQSRYCQPKLLRSAAIFRLRLAEEAIGLGERDVIDDRLEALENGVRSALGCEPADAFLWMVLAWANNLREGPKPEQLTFLRLSYSLGPSEGWIAVRRNRLALSMFPRLPSDLANASVSEFGRMVNSWFYREALAIFTGPGWPIRDRLLASLRDAGERQREAFAIQLYTEGYDLIIPGIAPREPRPWY
jgi:hypothetical protein